MTFDLWIRSVFWLLTCTYSYYSCGTQKMMKELLKYATLRNPNLDVFHAIAGAAYSLNNTASSVMGLTHYAFYGWDCVDPTDHSLDVDCVIPAGLIRFAEELRNEARWRIDLIKQCKVIAAQQMKHKYDHSIVALQKGDLVLIDSHNHPWSSKTMHSSAKADLSMSTQWTNIIVFWRTWMVVFCRIYIPYASFRK